MLLLLTKLAQMELDEMNGKSKKSTPKDVFNIAKDTAINSVISDEIQKRERKQNRKHSSK